MPARAPQSSDLKGPHKAEASYAELRQLLIERGLFKRQPGQSSATILGVLLLFGLGLFLTLHLHGFLPGLFTICYMAFVSTQMGFVVHSAGHGQLSIKRWKNDLIGLVAADFFLGLSYSWWNDTHNRHHRSPNHLGCDPDIDFVLLAFSQEQAIAKKGVARFFVRYQAYLFLPLLFLEATSLRVESIRFLLTKRSPYISLEIVGLIAHYVLVLWFLMHFLGTTTAAMFAAGHDAAFGFYLGMIFVTNHKGMPLIDDDTRMGSVAQQVVTSRNLRPHRFRDYLFGGLASQIEHHLFPVIPTSKLRAAQSVVRPYCERYQINYHETGLLECYVEVLRHLHSVGAPLRKHPLDGFNGRPASD